ncbi:MAG: VWA domain-containing protein [Blastocatellia bacterium]|nr:VWA domain-containing protein [Blastocatellia bacterium]MCS7156771.1 VWA domain-containing protein [Blastocatellia bacterium]MCX7752729.1 VWA domain-containing protein [Blastocatellia bacterium]MDW8167461.1 VWA domain-containing protein [Acidobacteriota bacterium]MDW8256808.1 VWA domain-containing protein [Acidobacteriota bacterium]
MSNRHLIPIPEKRKRRHLAIGFLLIGLGLPIYPLSFAWEGRNRENASRDLGDRVEQKLKRTDAEEPGEQVHLSARLVNVFFTATDRRHAIVTDLRREEVRVFEDGQEQEVFTFVRQTDLPLTIALLIDVSASQQYTLPEAKAAAAQFIRSLVRPGKDVVAIVIFRDEVFLIEDFTSTVSRLEAALNRVRYTPPTGHDPRFGGTSLYDAILLTSRELLAQQPGRRTILLLTDGEDTTSLYRLQDAIAEALRAEVTIYAIGIGDRYRFGINSGVLRRLTQETGGRAYFPKNTNDLARAFREIETELRSQYLVAYYPSNPNPDGRFRQIEIRVPTRKGLHIRHRRGYIL